MSARFRRGFVAVLATSLAVAACGWDPSRPFEREAPEVNQAIASLDAGDPKNAAATLQEYLKTGACEEGSIGTPERVKERPNGTFDLGLALFGIAESFGHRFGDEENDAGFLDPNMKGMRAGQVECALRVVRAIAADPGQALDLRARAHYLEGNLLFLNANYEEAVRAYDKALALAPGMGDAGPIGASDGGRFEADPVGRDAAWNRAVALRRIEDKKDAGKDAESDADSDGGDGGGQGDDGGQDGGGNDGGDDAGPDGGGGDDGDDAGQDAGGQPPKPDPKDDDEKSRDAAPPPPPSRQSQDERILDQLENAPTVQQEDAKRRAEKRRVRGMADK